jgi:hypothetical protein
MHTCSNNHNRPTHIHSIYPIRHLQHSQRLTSRSPVRTHHNAFSMMTKRKQVWLLLAHISKAYIRLYGCIDCIYTQMHVVEKHTRCSSMHAFMHACTIYMHYFFYLHAFMHMDTQSCTCLKQTNFFSMHMHSCVYTQTYTSITNRQTSSLCTHSCIHVSHKHTYSTNRLDSLSPSHLSPFESQQRSNTSAKPIHTRHQTTIHFSSALLPCANVP